MPMISLVVTLMMGRFVVLRNQPLTTAPGSVASVRSPYYNFERQNSVYGLAGGPYDPQTLFASGIPRLSSGINGACWHPLPKRFRGAGARAGVVGECFLGDDSPGLYQVHYISRRIRKPIHTLEPCQFTHPFGHFIGF